MLAAYDGLLTESDRADLLARYHGGGVSLPSIWVGRDYIAAPESAVVRVAQQFHGFDDFAGVEIWTHNNTYPGEHKDKDELLFSRTGEERYPLCSIVVYLEIVDLLGGELNCAGIRIKPIQNRVVTFAPGLLHNVSDFCGKRFVLAINPWKDRPEGFNV